MGIKIEVTTRIEGTIEPADLGRYLIAHVAEELGVEDDAGCDWITDAKDNTYIGGFDWQVSRYPKHAFLVNAANVLIYGYPMTVEETQNANL